MIDEIDKKIIGLIQGNMPIESRPFKKMAEDINISEDQLLNRIQSLLETGVIRRFGATLRHQEAGFNSNAMVAWFVPEDLIEEIGEKMAEFREVTHCYHRESQKDWKYNLYTMIHGENRDECHNIAERMAEVSGIGEYILLFSEKEFKKTSMKYF